jgi:sortase A
VTIVLPAVPAVDAVAGRGGRAFRAAARVAGELLVTLGVIVLLFAAYEVYGKTALIHDQQSALENQLAQAWGVPAIAPTAAPGAAALAPPSGNAVGRLYLPKLHLHWVVVEGVAPRDIRYGPGHYPGTALPGQPGNFSVAGHRVIGIFWDLDRIQPGDVAIVETRTGWYVYRVTENHIVTPHSTEVVAPLPNRPGVAPDGAYLTMTTCNPKYNNYQRMAVHARLVGALPHDQRPAELGS